MVGQRRPVWIPPVRPTPVDHAPALAEASHDFAALGRVGQNRDAVDPEDSSDSALPVDGPVRVDFFQWVPIDSLQLADRDREDDGDLDALADSLRRAGFAQALLADHDNVVWKGGRRLKAARKAGLTEVPIVRAPAGTPHWKLVRLALEGVRQTKPVGRYEHARLVMDAAGAALEAAGADVAAFHLEAATPVDSPSLDWETRSKVVQVTRGLRGPALTPGSYRWLSQVLGIPLTSIHRYAKVVQALQTYPDLEAHCRNNSHILETARELDGLGDDDRAAFLRRMRYGEPGVPLAITSRSIQQQKADLRAVRSQRRQALLQEVDAASALARRIEEQDAAAWLRTDWERAVSAAETQLLPLRPGRVWQALGDVEARRFVPVFERFAEYCRAFLALCGASNDSDHTEVAQREGA